MVIIGVIVLIIVIGILLYLNYKPREVTGGSSTTTTTGSKGILDSFKNFDFGSIFGGGKGDKGEDVSEEEFCTGSDGTNICD